MVKQAHIINPRCGVQIFSTEHGCRKYDVKCVIWTGMRLTSLTITNSEIFTKLWLFSKGIAILIYSWNVAFLPPFIITWFNRQHNFIYVSWLYTQSFPIISDNEQFSNRYMCNVEISLIFTLTLIAAELPLTLVCLLTASKLYFVLIVLIRKITTARIGRNI